MEYKILNSIEKISKLKTEFMPANIAAEIIVNVKKQKIQYVFCFLKMMLSQ